MLMPSIFGERLFDDFMDDFAAPTRSRAEYRNVSNVMRTDVRETEQGYEVDIELPGYKKEDVKVELKDGYLTINASTNTSKDEKNEKGKYIHRERYYGSCSRSFYVGEYVTHEDIKAKFEDGILKLSVPKKVEKPVEEKKFITIEG